MAVSKTIQEQLPRIKKNISSSYLYFKDNCNRYHDYRKFVFDTSINQDQKAVLQSANKPVIEFNILDAYISRLLGEFAMHEPSIEVTPAEGVPVSEQVIKVVEDYIRHIVYEANKDSMSYEVYKDLLSGGFSVVKVWTEYASPMSMKHIIRTSRAFDPTLCGFDPMARYSHKGDGQYSFELFPMTDEDFMRNYPNANKSEIGFSRHLEEFQWSYKNDKGDKTVILGDYYEKKKKHTQIIELADGQVMPLNAYKKLPEWWEQQGFIEQIPLPVGKPRWTDLETICRYKIIENEILEYEETDYTYLPHIFVDGNSILLRQGTSNCMYQMTRPYVYHAKGIQNLKNFSGQALANYLENQVQHKFIVMKEALPQEEDYLQALTDIQHSNTIVVNAYSENNPEKPIPTPIREVVNVPAPPEVMGAFQVTDPTTQTILGSFASNLSKNDNDLSGKAVIETATIGNSAAMPYVNGYLQAWTQLGNIIVDLMPKYFKGKRELPTVSLNGEKGYQKVNEKGMPSLDYQANSLSVKIETGVNFQVQKNQALQQITSLMQASQEFAQFMNSPLGLPVLVKNLTVYGADELQAAVPEYLKNQQQQQEQMMKMQESQMQNDPAMLRAKAELMKVQTDAQQKGIENQLAIAKQATEDKLADAKVLEAEAKISQAQVDSAIRLEEGNTSIERHALDAAATMAKIKGEEHVQMMKEKAHSLEERKLEHEIKKGDKNVEA